MQLGYFAFARFMQDTGMQPFPLPITYNVQRDVMLGSEQLINMYPVPAPHTINKVGFVPASGFKGPITVGIGTTVRAMQVFKDKLYVVVSDNIYSVDSALVVTQINTAPLGTNAGYVGISENVNQIVFVDGADLYVWDVLTNTYTVPAGLPFVASDITGLDGYLIAIDKDTNKWYQSALNDGTTWAALDFVVFDSVSDTLTAIRVIERRIHVFGKKVVEIWEDAGATPFAFRRNNNALLEHGCIAPWTVVTTTIMAIGVMLYVARNPDGAPSVVMIEGTSFPKRISNEAIELFLQNAADIEDCSALLYKENGLTFYQLNFTSANRTFCYVLEAKSWFEKSMPDFSRHPAQAHAFFNNKHYIGLFNENKIYEQNYQFLEYNGELIRCILITEGVYGYTHAVVRVDRVELECSQGIPSGTLPNQAEYSQLNELIVGNERPEVIMFVSRDGGRTYGNGIPAKMGKLGEYKFRTIWYRIGSMNTRRFVFKFEFPYKIPFILSGAYIQAEVLPE
jgi:hypothetical protein